VRWLKTIFLISFILLLNVSPKVKANTHLTVLVPNFPPYTLETNNQISGIGIDLANKVFNQAGISVNYRILPNYAKALHEIENNRGDALLLASQNDQRDIIAQFTKPLMINRWCWYLLKDSKLNPHNEDFKEKAVVSSHFQANTHKWLIENDYSVEPAMQIDKLPEMLMRSRVDAVFIAELVFEEAMKRDNLDLSQFNKYIEVERPFGIYISKTYLAKYPEVLNKVNQAIDKKIVNNF
jgi:ABC-type amino acid transport substrate-binding protein